MEELSKILQPYKEIVSQSAQWLTIAQMLSPLLVLNDMRKSKSTKGMPIYMFAFFLVVSILGIRFGQLLNDDATYNANLVGVALSIVSVSTHYFYSTPEEKSTTTKVLFYGVIYTTAVLLYSKYEDPEKVPHRFGLIFTSMFYIFIIFPILDIRKAIKEKCTQHFPFAMIISGTAVGLSWALHGIIIQSGVIVVQNAFLLAINFVQLSMFLIYPSEPVKEDKKKK
ncbi:hypothetical protein PVAND_015095 [Polypedilum vanderplanki]|uniref:Sugar transporter SWEET n=1 Tax=Polypedilum vanderplanki TaxID=319348 RepID=A0A9J6BC09_POLVA|nr:hypothetical protein PVAND_015095 [Polypedilum vanderplanki]